MAERIKYKVVSDNGVCSCGDLGVCVEEWCSLLLQPKAEQYIDVLLCFMREINHAATCMAIAQRYGGSPSFYVGRMNEFSEWVEKSLDKFVIMDAENDADLWLVPMQKGRNTTGGIEWQLRDELVEALQLMLKRKLVQEYKKYLFQQGSLEACNEIYKWQIAAEGQGGSVQEIMSCISKKSFNLIDKQYSCLSLLSFVQAAPEIASTAIEDLEDEKIDISERVEVFYTTIRSVWNQKWGKTIPNDERTMAAILATYAPKKYCYYKYDIYVGYCNYLGVEHRKTRHCYAHFLELMQELYVVIAEDRELALFIFNQTDQYVHSEIFCSQDVVWQMQYWIGNQVRKFCKPIYWMAGYTLDNENKCQQFLDEGMWMGVGSASVNKRIEAIEIGDVIILKSTYTKGEGHKISVVKISAIGRVSSKPVKGDKYYRCSVNWIAPKEKEFTGFKGSYQQTFHQVTDDLFINYANSMLEMERPSKYQNYIDLLISTRNLVLTGAPGTGKTYMARAIAQDMGAEVKFVQFHPSYDYTDFVEGLRPVDLGNGQIGFERRDGLFKSFCKEAIKNLIDSEKSVDDLEQELSWQEKLEQFIEDAVENCTKYKTIKGNEFRIADLRGHNIVIYNEQNEKTPEILVNADEVIELLTNKIELNIVRDIKTYFKHKHGTQADSYSFAIIKEVRKLKSKNVVTAVSKVERKPYVLIIDEINRGEASKIFGELFYAIDPGYRGKTDMVVQTQYQNLISETDVFAKGFYVPDNMFILATMNDIDRSVESMDFAMRRRFSWVEVRPTDTQDMLDVLDGVLATVAKATMKRLNEKIAETDGLGSDYMIGPAYFLKLKENGGDFEKLWVMNIEPLLREYLRGFRRIADTLEKFRRVYFEEEKIIEESNVIDD